MQPGSGQGPGPGGGSVTIAEHAPRRPRRRIKWLGTAAIVAVALGAGTIIQDLGLNQQAHYALIRALSDGTARIDAYAFTTGIDGARYRGHWYSLRAPGLAVLTLPAYSTLRAAGVDELTETGVGNRSNDEMVWLLTLWAALLPAVGTMLLVRFVADRIAPGFGAAAAVTLGAGTLLLPFSTLLFAHALSAFLGFASFTFLWAERELRRGRERLWTFAVAGVLAGYAITTEYPLLFLAVVLGIYAISCGDPVRRGIAYAAGAIAGVVPLAIYNEFAFGALTHVAYGDNPSQQHGFFGIGLPRPAVAIELLFSSRGLLTLAPVLVMAAIGIGLMYRRGRRAEAWVIAAISLVYLAYNTGYYLPYGGATPGPRYLIATLPFLALGLAPAYRRFPAVTLGLAAVSIVCMAIPTMVSPLVSTEADVGKWMDALGGQDFQATAFTAAGVSAWPSVIPFLACLVIAVGLAAAGSPHRRLTWRSVAAAGACLGAWSVLATYAPRLLGIDSAAEHVIFSTGDPLALQEPYGPHPLSSLVVVALTVGSLALLVGAVASRVHRPDRARSGRNSDGRVLEVREAESFKPHQSGAA
jgi:hypothetical protein